MTDRNENEESLDRVWPRYPAFDVECQRQDFKASIHEHVHILLQAKVLSRISPIRLRWNTTVTMPTDYEPDLVIFPTLCFTICLRRMSN